MPSLRPPALLSAGRACRWALPAALILGLTGCPAGDASRSSDGDGRQVAPDAPRFPAGREGDVGLMLLRSGDLKGAEPALLEASRQAPHDGRLLEALGFVYSHTDRWRRAEEVYRAAILASPRSASAHLGLVEVLIGTGRNEEALEALGEVRRLNPDSLEAQVKEALLLQRTGRPAEAIAKARAVIARRPSAAEAHYVLGLALMDEGDLEGAASEFGRVVQEEPDHLGALGRWVTVATRLGRPQEAERAREAHRKALTRRRVEERVRGHRLKGVEAFNRGDYAQALQEFEAIAREDPADFQAPLYIGSAQIALGKRDEARAALRKSLQLQPRNERALMELGRLEALENHLEAAVTALRQAIAVNPEFAEPHYFLAGVHSARGEIDAAREELRRYEELKARSTGSAMELVTPGTGEAP